MFGISLESGAGRFKALDGLRGLAVLFVFLSHMSNKGLSLFPNTNFSGIGKPGVYAFFVLSSFLLTYSFLVKRTKVFSIDFFANYFVRRVARIYPLYSLYLLLGLISSWTIWRILGSSEPIGIPFVLTVDEFFRHILLLQGKSVTWSILVEFRYYFVLPLLAIIYIYLLDYRFIVSSIFTVILLSASIILWPPSLSYVNDPRLGPYLPIFFMGSYLALLYHHWNLRGMQNNRRLRYAVETLGLTAMVVIVLMTPSVMSLIVGRSLPFDTFHKQFLLFGFLWSLVLFSALCGLGVVGRLLELSVLRYLGFISFSIYLLHPMVKGIFAKFGEDLPLLAWIILAVTVLLSHISYLIIEKPSSNIRLNSLNYQNKRVVNSA